MNKYAIIIDDIVSNVVISDFPLEDNWYPCSDEIIIGDLLVDGVVTPKMSRADWERYERDIRLERDVDPIAGNALRWADLSSEEQLKLATYRQALLDIPEQKGFPEDVIWPTL